KKTSFRDLFLRTILQRAIRKNAATRDATDEAVQNQVTRYLKGAADCAGGRRLRGGPSDLPRIQMTQHQHNPCHRLIQPLHSPCPQNTTEGDRGPSIHSHLT
ncbi:hypothetical protein UPYG_G00001560, partial [Umbra pygmaea]